MVEGEQRKHPPQARIPDNSLVDIVSTKFHNQNLLFLSMHLDTLVSGLPNSFARL